MRPIDDVEKLIAEMKVKRSAELDARVYRAIQTAQAERKTNQPGSWLPELWSLLMKTHMTKWAATAAILVAVGGGLLLFTKSVSTAFAIERVIAAYDHVRFLHVKTSGAKQREPNEFWIQTDASGQVAKARYYLPETDDGVKLVTWTPARAEIWFKRKQLFLICQTKRIQPWMQSFLDQSQPELVVQKLAADKKAGRLDIQVQAVRDSQQPVLMTVVHKGKPEKEIYTIDPKTELISRIDFYRTGGTGDVLKATTEFSDYNVPIDEKLFSLQGELPPGTRIADQLSQVIGVAQGGLTDAQAATETVRQFCQALKDKDYKKAGLIEGGELEEYVQAEYGDLQVASIVSVGPAVLQTNWVKRGYRVFCELAVVQPDGQTSVWKPGAYVRPGDDEEHPNHWNITGGISGRQAKVQALPDRAKYEKMSPKEVAQAFFQACAETNWEEVIKFWPMPAASDPHFARMKDYLGGLKLISLGEPYKSDNYAGWYVPYEIKLPPTEVYARVANTNAAGRYVLTGLYDRRLQVQEQLPWPSEPEVLPNNAAYAKMSPTEVVQAYFESMAKEDWDTMRKFAPQSDVDETKGQVAAAKKEGLDFNQQLPVVDAGAAPQPDGPSAYFVKCHIPAHVKKWNLALQKDNEANRFLFDGGL